MKAQHRGLPLSRYLGILDPEVADDLDSAATWVLYVCDERRQKARLTEVARMMTEAMFGSGQGDVADADRFVEAVSGG